MKFSVLAAVVPTVLAAPVRVPMKKRSDEEFKIVRRAQAVTQAAQRGDTGSITIKDYSNAQVSPFPLSLATDFARTYIFFRKKVMMCRAGHFPSSALENFPRATIPNPFICRSPIAVTV